MPTVETFIDPTTVMFTKLVIAMILGGLIGTERAILARQAPGWQYDAGHYSTTPSLETDRQDPEP